MSDFAGRNATDARAGLESDVANADPPEIWGRPCGAEQEIDADNSPGFAGIVGVLSASYPTFGDTKL